MLNVGISGLELYQYCLSWCSCKIAVCFYEQIITITSVWFYEAKYFSEVFPRYVLLYPFHLEVLYFLLHYTTLLLDRISYFAVIDFKNNILINDDAS